MRIYVGNIPWSMTEDELESLFSAHGQVNSADIVTDRAGTDVLLFAGVLTLFAIPVAAADLLASAARAGGTGGSP